MHKNLPKRGKVATTFMMVLLITMLMVSLLPEATVASSPVSLKATTSYYVSAEPARIQEGLNTAITVGVNGGEANTTYPFIIDVTDPTLARYNATLVVSTNATGSGSNFTLYYGGFSAGANTNYVGTYAIVVNETLTTGNFTVGLTDKLEYTRIDDVLIRGSGYNADEIVTVDIATSGTSVTDYPKNVTAGTNGVVTHTWLIPDNAILGSYTVTLTNATAPGTFKPDVQNFSIVFMERPLVDPAIGRWGTPVRVIGEIFTLGGQYRILWDGRSMKEGSCGSNSGVVNATFTLPPSVKGDHNITLYDVTNGTESESSTFTVTTSCYVLAEPARVLEGLAPTLTVGVGEAKANTTYTFKTNVTDPPNRTWSANVLVTTNKNGSGEKSITYGSATNYLGTYSITVNETLATGSFTAGLTDELEYRRTKRVIIQGAGYNATGNVTISITKDGISVKGYPKNVTTSEQGVATDLWTIPENATLGIYTVTLTNATTGKVKRPIPDIQNFTIIDIIIYCQTQNKYDKEPLADVSVGVYFEETLITSGKTNTTGWVEFRLDRGNVTFRAFWEGEQVGSLENQSITGNVTEYMLQKMFNVECELAHITIVINDEANPPNPLPFINVTLASNKTGPIYLPETDFAGITATNTFTNTSYTIEARRYGHLFNRTLIENLTFTCQINIACPTYTLFVHVLDSKGLPLQNVTVVAYEWSSQRVTGSETTNDLGSVTVSCTFGRYKIRVYDRESEILLNETVIDLIEDKSFLVLYCRIFNLDLSVVVKDYFGHPIPKALVKVEREGVEIGSLTTGSNGTVSLHGIIGGDYRISVYVTENLEETRTLYLDETKVVVFKLDKYLVVGGYLMETTQLITWVSLGIMVALFVLALTFRRLRKVKEKSL